MFNWVQQYHEIRKTKTQELVDWILEDEARMHLMLDEFDRLAEAYQALLADPMNDELGATAIQSLEAMIDRARSIGWVPTAISTAV